jgi:hypothetical protein
MIKLKSLLKEESVYQKAGAMIPQIGPATQKNKQKHIKEPDAFYGIDSWKKYVKNDADEDKLFKATDEYIKWLDTTIPALDKIHNSDMYKMHLASLESGGSSRSNYDYLKNFIDSMGNAIQFIKKYK